MHTNYSEPCIVLNFGAHAVSGLCFSDWGLARGHLDVSYKRRRPGARYEPLQPPLRPYYVIVTHVLTNTGTLFENSVGEPEPKAQTLKETSGGSLMVSLQT